MNSVQFGNSQITYKVHKTKRRTTEIIVDTSGVEILTSKQKSHNDIQNLVKKHSRWIFRKQLWANKQSDLKITFKHGSKIPYLGKNYFLQIINAKNESIVLSHDKFIIKVKNNTTKKVQEIFKNWLKEHAQKIIEDKTYYYAKKLGVKFDKIIIKDHKERWGSISKNNVINVNLSILCAPTKIIDYVIIHELCHLKIPDHSSKYWNLLYKMMPEYESHKEWLSVNWRLLNF